MRQGTSACRTGPVHRPQGWQAAEPACAITGHIKFGRAALAYQDHGWPCVRVWSASGFYRLLWLNGHCAPNGFTRRHLATVRPRFWLCIHQCGNESQSHENSQCHEKLRNRQGLRSICINQCSAEQKKAGHKGLVYKRFCHATRNNSFTAEALTGDFGMIVVPCRPKQPNAPHCCATGANCTHRAVAHD